MKDFINEPSDKETVDIFRNSSNNSPEEAAKTIKRAEQLDMHPDSYEKMKTTLDPELNIQERVPAQVSQSVKNHASKSSNHAKLVENETGILEDIASQAKFIAYNLVGKREDEHEIQDLVNKKRNSDGVLPAHEQEYLNNLVTERNEKLKSFDLEGFEQIPGQVAGVVGDAFEAIGNNKALIAGTTAVGAFTPVPFGAGAGFGFGVTAALAKDTYFRVADSTYLELDNALGDDGAPLNLDHNTKDNIAMSVGVVSGALELVTGKVLTAGLLKLVKPKSAVTEIIKNTALKTSMDVLGHATKSAVVSGGEESVAEIVAIVGENFARGIPTEAGLINAMTKTANDIANDPEVRKRLGMTAIVGFAAGGTIAGTTASLTSRKIKGQYDKLNLNLEEIERQRVQTETIKNAVSSLDSQDNILDLAKLTLNTELKQLSPEQMTEFRQELFREAGYEGKVWFSDTDIETITNADPELAQKIKNMDITEASNSETNSHVGIEPHQFLDLVEESPTISEYARLNPEAPNPLESKNVLERFNEAEAQRKEVFASLGVGEQLTPEQIQIFKNLDEDIEASTRDAGEEGYVNQTKIFTDAMESVIPEDQLERYKAAQLESRKAVADQINKEFDAKEIRIENKVVKANEEIEKTLQTQHIKKELEVVEKFKFDKIKQSPDHRRKGHSNLAIDPKHLPDDLREALITEPKLIKRKVFVEGGITLEESAALAGVDDGETLLKILANTPTKKEMLATRRKKSAELRKQVKEVREKTEKDRRNKVFDDQNNLHLRDMKFMKDHQWSATKQGVKTIVLPVPRIAELNNTARKVIAKTRMNELNPRQFNASEKNLNKKAANHILKNEAEEAFIAKERAMLNTELTRESLRAREEIDSAKVFVKKLTSRKGLETLKKSGLLPKVNTLLDLFDLNPSKQQAAVQESYFKYLKRINDQGKSVIVPKSLADVRQRGTDLTVEEYLRITNKLRTLNHQAQQKNKIIKRVDKITKLEELRTEEAIVSDLVIDLETNHPDFDVKKTKKIRNENSVKLIDKMKERYGLGVAAITNLKNITTTLDQEALGEQHFENVAQPMIDAETFKRSKLSDVVTQIKKITTQYGEKNYSIAFNDEIEIDEFKGYYELGDGVMVRSDLWTLLAYLGDPQARERIANFINPDTQVPMSIETVQKVLSQHLSEADAKLTQNFVNIFKSFTKEAADLHERTTGVVPTMVKGVPIQHKDKVLDGGYVPNNYLNTSEDEKIERYLEVLGDKESSMFGGKKDGKLYSRLRTAEQTEQGRLIDRTSSSRPLDTDFRTILHAYEEHVHDLSYREVGTKTLKLLRNPLYKQAVRSTVGNEKYNTMVNSIIETVGRSASEDVLNPFSKEQGAFNRAMELLSRNFAVATLGFKATSVAMQPLSFGAATLRMGPKGGSYLLKSFGHIIKNVHNYSEIFNDAAAINPDIKFNKDSVDDSLVKSYFSELPETQRFKHAQKLASLRRAKQSFVDASLIGLKKLDIHIKVATTIASYNQFLAGDVKNFPLARLDKMSDVEKISRARKYSKQIADLALTTSATIDKSAVEKISILRMFTMFYTDLRSQLNTSTSQLRKVRNSSKRIIADVKDGNLPTATGNFKSGAVDFAALFAIHTLSQMYTSLLYDQENPLTELSEVNDMEDFKSFLGNTTGFILKAPLKGVAGSTIISRDILFSLTSDRINKTISFPLNRVFSDFTMGISAIADILEGEELDNAQITSSFYATAVATGLPLVELIKFAENVPDSDLAKYAANFIQAETKRLSKAIDKYIDKNPKKEENIKKLLEIKKDFIPAENQDGSKLVPEDSIEVLELNKWDDIDPTTGAAGIYQFTEDRWNEIAEADPSLGLSDNGRVSKDSLEQKKAMKWSLEHNAKNLTAYQIPVNNSNLYGAHRFGVDDYVAVLLSDNSEKIDGIVENKELFKNFKTVKSVKDYIDKTIDNEKR